MSNPIQFTLSMRRQRVDVPQEKLAVAGGWSGLSERKIYFSSHRDPEKWECVSDRVKRATGLIGMSRKMLNRL
jgi:hypothetical protein